MLLRNAIAILSKYGKISYVRTRNKSNERELSVNITSELQVRASVIGDVKTGECGPIRTYHVPSDYFQIHRSLKSAIRWCLDLKYPAFQLNTLCGRPIILNASIFYDLDLRESCCITADLMILSPFRSYHNHEIHSNRSIVKSSEAEPLAIVHGMLEGNYAENVLADFLLEYSPDFERIWSEGRYKKLNNSKQRTSVNTEFPSNAQRALLRNILLGTSLKQLNFFDNHFDFKRWYFDFEEMAMIAGVSQCNQCNEWDNEDVCHSRCDEDGYLCRRCFSQLKRW